MLAQIPRTPLFPQHMIIKEIRRIEKDVEDDVIPVSAGIYSEHKLVERLQVIPKPEVVNYQDPIFFDTIDTSKFPCKAIACPLCGQQYGSKKNQAIQCHFCGVWNCQNCMCPRKRYHPRAKESSSQRFSICYKCDDKFLSLTLNHGFVEQRALLEEVMKRVRKQKDEYQFECDKLQSDSDYAKDTVNKNKFKISSMKKEQIDLKKNISKLQAQREEETMKLRVRQKYMAILLKKKEAVRAKNETSVTIVLPQSMEEPKSPAKPVRSLSHSNVYSQSIKIEQRSHQQQKESARETAYSRTEQTAYSPPLEKTLEPPKQEKINNFYNYHEWNTEQKGAVVQLSQQESGQALETENTKKINPIIQNETSVQIKIESSTQRKLTKIAQIFAKPEKPTPQEDYSSQEEVQSLDGEVIKIRKAALMKAAIEQSHRSRIEEMDTEMFDQEPKKCSCQIY